HAGPVRDLARRAHHGGHGRADGQAPGLRPGRPAGAAADPHDRRGRAALASGLLARRTSGLVREQGRERGHGRGCRELERGGRHLGRRARPAARRGGLPRRPLGLHLEQQHRATAQRPRVPRRGAQRAGHARRDRRARQGDREGDPRRRVRDGDRDAERAVRRLAAGNARRAGGTAGVARQGGNACRPRWSQAGQARAAGASRSLDGRARRAGGFHDRATASALALVLALAPACAGGSGLTTAPAPAPIAAAEHFVRRIDPFPVLDEHGRAYTYPFLGGLNNPRPQLVDIDDDGDLDLFVQERSDEVMFFENTGGAFVWRTDKFQGLDVGEWFRFVDLDRDGDPDLLAERPYSMIRYFRNDGGRFVAAADTLFDDQGEPIFSDRQNIPNATDIDCDGLQDLFLGQLTGTVTRYEATGPVGASPPPFTLVTTRFENIEIVNALGASAHGANTMVFTDVEGDGDEDLFWGDFFEPGILLI